MLLFFTIANYDHFTICLRWRFKNGVVVCGRTSSGGGNYILHKLLADWTNLLAECSGEHHDLLAMWCVPEDFLNVTSHI